MTEEEEFIQSLYDEAEEQIKEVYKEQKKNRDELLNEIAKILLTYTILNDLMSLSRVDRTKEYTKLSKLITKAREGQGTTQEKVIKDILSSSVNRTFDFYSYNAKLKDVKKIIEDNFKGKHFSERVWENETDVAKHLHKQVNDFLNGKVNVNQIKKDIERTYNTSAYNAKRLTETEVSRCSSNAFDRFCRETGVKKLKYNATLDSKLCSDCGQYHNEVSNLNNKIELPRHPLCRCFYTIEDENSYGTDFDKNKNKNNLDDNVVGSNLKINNNENIKPKVTIEKSSKVQNTNNKIADKEKDALEYYTSDGFKRLNDRLRNGSELDKGDIYYMKNISSGLSKLPNFSGTTYRSVTFMDESKFNEFVKQFKEGGNITFKEFISSTLDKTAYGNKFIGKTDVQLVIKSLNGKDITKYSMNKVENEVLFDKGSSFFIKKISKNNFGGTVIEVEQF